MSLLDDLWKHFKCDRAVFPTIMRLFPRVEAAVDIWLKTPARAGGPRVTVSYQIDPENPGAFRMDRTGVEIAGHPIDHVHYMAIEGGRCDIQPYILLAQASGHALRLPLGDVVVQPWCAKEDRECVHEPSGPVPPEIVEWDAIYKASRFEAMCTLADDPKFFDHAAVRAELEAEGFRKNEAGDWVPVDAPAVPATLSSP